MLKNIKNMNRIFNYLRENPRLFIGILVLYYTVGLALFIIPATRSLFSRLTPLSLILSFSAVLIFQKTWNWKTGVAFITVFLVSILVEMVGVHTGVLFGHYQYGSALGPKILDTPVIIGLNWLMLIYCTSAIVQKVAISKTGRILLGSVLMVAYDGVLEYVAPVTDMWAWETRYPGFRNFGMWFLLSVVFHILFQLLGLRIDNKPARYLFLIHFLLFVCLALYIATS